MSYIITVIALLIVLGVVLYFKRKKAKGATFADIIKRPLNDTPNKEKEQDEQNCQFIAELIKGHYSHKISSRARNKSIKKFRKWQEKMNFIFKVASPESIALRNRYIEEKLKLNTFKFTYVQVSPCLATKKRPEGWQLFCKNGFTEPFPSFHDMDDWAVVTKLTDFFVLNGITPEDSPRFVFHEKRHYVNHEMQRGIIQFDLYKMPA